CALYPRPEGRGFTAHWIKPSQWAPKVTDVLAMAFVSARIFMLNMSRRIWRFKPPEAFALQLRCSALFEIHLLAG
ncbi:MAG: hypothetical protein OXI66_00800, partial [Boseongicola sp.]|nr:hypothetical protein [Boseongicola sp.]